MKMRHALNDVSPRFVAVLCFVWVAASSLCNLPLELVSRGLLESAFGEHFPDNSRPVLLILTMAIHTSLYAALFVPLYLLMRHRSVFVRNVAITTLTILYIGCWVAWTTWLAAR